MTNREKLHEIAGRLGADADLAVVRAALLAVIRVLLGVDAASPRPPFGGALTIETIKKMILGSFGVCQSGGDLVEPCTPDELFLSARMKLVPMCREALDELVAEGKVSRTEATAANGAPLYEMRARSSPRVAERAAPEIVCLCGSTRFYEAFQRRNYEETIAGRIVLSVGHYPNSDGAHGELIGCTPEQKIALEELHKRKIDLASRIIVLNVGGYVGESTKSEIAYAVAHHKGVTFLEPDAGERFMEERSDELGALVAGCARGYRP